MSSRADDNLPTLIREKLPNLPDEPGVYLHKDERGRILYIGKARHLIRRVRSYFQQPESLDVKTQQLVARVVDLDYIVTDTEKDALVLEDQLIKEYRPRYNIRLKDDKRYPYIRISMNEPFPAVSIVRQLDDDGARYFGPYTDVSSMRYVLNHALRMFQVRTCTLEMPEKMLDRPCLDYQIQKCPGPCVGYEDAEQTRRRAEQLCRFFSGQDDQVLVDWRAEMTALSEDRRYEDAAGIRDRIKMLEKTVQKMTRIEGLRGDMDICAMARDGVHGCGVVMRVRMGRILSTATFHLEDKLDQDVGGFMAQMLREYYPRAGDLPAHVLVSHDPGNMEDWCSWLSELRKANVDIRVPQRGNKRQACDLALHNAAHKLNERLLNKEEGRRIKPGSTTDLQTALSLHTVPETMECFDISTFQGRQTVGSLVYFRNGEPLKSRYRRFRIKTVEGTDDYASMHEVLSRYYGRLREKNLHPADLVIIDGGKGQLGVAEDVITGFGFTSTTVIGLAKREETIHLTDGREIVLPRSSKALKLVQRIRDEAHRFAITYHRNLRASETLASELDLIPGVGPVKKLALLHHFGSLKAIKAANIDQLQEVRGLGSADARRIIDFFLLRREGPAS
jgi:excinuclease ABC subunit C